MKNTFNRLLNNRVLKITEDEYNELIQTDQKLYGDSISTVQNEGTDYCFIPYQIIRHAQPKPLIIKYAELSAVEKEELIKKFTKATMHKQLYLK